MALPFNSNPSSFLSSNFLLSLSLHSCYLPLSPETSIFSSLFLKRKGIRVGEDGRKREEEEEFDGGYGAEWRNRVVVYGREKRGVRKTKRERKRKNGRKKREGKKARRDRGVRIIDLRSVVANIYDLFSTLRSPFQYHPFAWFSLPLSSCFKKVHDLRGSTRWSDERKGRKRDIKIMMIVIIFTVYSLSFVFSPSFSLSSSFSLIFCCWNGRKRKKGRSQFPSCFIH